MWYNELYYPYDEHDYRDSINKENMSNKKDKQKQYSIYVIGHGVGYARWIPGHLTRNMEDADVVILTGGEDISSELYNEPKGPSTYFTPSRDAFELREYDRAKSLNKVIWGTCRGAQFLCAMAGGKLIQDMNHGGSHRLHFYDGEYTCVSNTLHHQMQYPFNLINKEDYYILASTYGISDYYRGGRNEDMEMPNINSYGQIEEPEFVYYPKIKGLGIQGHPEMMDINSPMVEVCTAFLNLEISGQLEDALQLELPVGEIILRSTDFKFTKKELSQLEKIKSRVVREQTAEV